MRLGWALGASALFGGGTWIGDEYGAGDDIGDVSEGDDGWG
jgi:hypothetical protein